MTTQPRENEISGNVVDAAYRVYSTLAPGLLESVYEAVLAHELMSRGHRVARRVRIGIRPTISSSTDDHGGPSPENSWAMSRAEAQRRRGQGMTTPPEWLLNIGANRESDLPE